VPRPRETATRKHEHASRKERLARWALPLVWYLGGIMAFAGIGASVTIDNAIGSDAHAYWLAARQGPSYDRVPGQTDAYLYSPVFLTAIRPLALLEWPIFLAVWVGIEVAVLVWLLKPLRLRWSVPIFLCCLPELVVGNVNVLLAGAAVIGMRVPATWAVPLLTKVTPGIGLLWFAFRGEWRRFLLGAASTAIIVLVSYSLDPSAWSAWAKFLLGQRQGTEDGIYGLVLRCLLAAAVLAVGAWKRQAWCIAPAMLLTSPILVNLPALALLTSIPRLSHMNDTVAASDPSHEARTEKQGNQSE
jgi:hypothetical protein